MTKILHITSSILGDNSESNAISQKLVDQLLAVKNGSELVTRDLNANPVPHLTAEAMMGFNLPATEQTDAQKEALHLSNRLIEELQVADTIVLTVPMYNFNVPSTLKTWVDYIARAGVTFRYTEMGPEGLLTGKKVYVVMTRGGVYLGSKKDTLSGFMETILSFFGLTDVEYIYAEGLKMGEDPRNEALEKVDARLKQLLAA